MYLRLQDGFALFLLAAFLAVGFPGLATLFLGGAMGFSVVEDLGLDAADRCVQDSLFQLTFPYDDDTPSFGFQLPPSLLVALFVPGDFRRPEIDVCLGKRIMLTVFMAMPKTTVNKNNGMVFSQNNIRRPRKMLIIYSIPVSLIPKTLPQEQFWFRPF